MTSCRDCQVPNWPGTLFCLGCGIPLGAAELPAGVTALPAPGPAREVELAPLAGGQAAGPAIALPDTAWEGELSLGRQDLAYGSVVDLDLARWGGREGGVSRRHARLGYAGGLLRLEDLASTHGTFLNRQRLAPHEPALLAHGDEIGLANLVFRLTIDQGAPYGRLYWKPQTLG